MESTIVSAVKAWEKDPYSFEYSGPTITYDGDTVVRAERSWVGGGYKRVYRAMRHITPCIWKETEDKIQTVTAGYKLQATLKHPNIAEIWSSSRLGDRLVMLQPDYGVSLAFIDLSWPSLHHVFMEVARGLVYLGKQGVVHGDLCQYNIFIGREGVWIGDYDAARHLPVDVGEKEPPGRLVFQAPEKLVGLPYGRKVDSYALGALMYSEMSGPWAMRDKTYRAHVERRGFHHFKNRYLPSCIRKLIIWRVGNLDRNVTVQEVVACVDFTIVFPDPDPSEGSLQEIIGGCLQPFPTNRLSAAQIEKGLARVRRWN